MRTKAPRIAHIVRFLHISHLLLWMFLVMYRERYRTIQGRIDGNVAVPAASGALMRVLLDFCDAAPKLGVLMVKLGQFLSARVDLLPQEAIAILSSLQDDIPPEPFEHVVYTLESELGKPVAEVFSMLESTCTAAASLGQVHKAVLAVSGEVVAVKVQRPNTDELISMDLQALRFVVWVIEHLVNTNGFVNLIDIFHEFESTIYSEIDYVQEAANARRFKEMFKHHSTIYVPRVYEQYVSRHVLVLEWVEGIKINNYTALDAARVNRLEVVKRTVYAYFYQFFEAGFFHADPHPGNIFVKEGSTGEEPIIIFLDFGMMSSHSKQIKRSLKDVFLAFLMRDAHSLAYALAKLGFIGEDANLTSIEHSLSLLIERYHGLTLKDISKVDIFAMVQESAQLFYGQPFHIPAQFAFLGRAMSTLMSIATELAPEFNVIEAALPYAHTFLGLDMEGVQQMLTQMLATGKALLALPCALEQAINQLQNGQIEIQVNKRSMHSRKKGGNQERYKVYDSNNLTWLLMFSISLLGGIFLLVATQQLVASWFCFSLTALITLRLVAKK